jgi:hypothetical protein
MIKIFGTLLFFICLPAYAINAAFFYGSPFPPELRIYDAVIVEPDHNDFPKVPEPLQSKLYAYTSLGEVAADKSYASQIPQLAKVSRNPAWSTDVLDQTSSVWRDFYIEKIVAPLWARGFRGVFIDTLDSYQLSAKTPEQRALQEAGMVETLRQLHNRFPGIRLILNRGFEILPQVHQWVTAVAAESLFQGWDNATHSFVSVNDANQKWLLMQLNKIKNDYRLPVIVIDYAAPKTRELAREISKKIHLAGFIPWVTNPELDMLGVGDLEIQPRRILMLYNSHDTKEIFFTEVHQLAAMPVQYMGFVPEYLDLSGPLPSQQLAGQYAGIIVWANVPHDDVSQLKPWLLKQIDQGIRVSIIGDFGFFRSEDNLQSFGLTVKNSVPAKNVEVKIQDPIFGFEHSPTAYEEAYEIISADKNSKTLLQLKVDGQLTDLAAYTSWGGYVLAPYVIFEIPPQQGIRWIINPFDFIKQSLKLPDLPVPDVTTSTGRRLLMAHMDGDGFPSNAEFPGSPLAGRVMLEKIFKKYPIPTAVSVIEAEIAPWGLYPQKSVEMEEIAREIFRLPYVEIASHSYSHPFDWQDLSANVEAKGMNMPIPGYVFNLNREIEGSVHYINERLAPPGKKCTILLWTGDCNPGSDAVIKADEFGVLNMNGGDTVITNSRPSLADVAPLGLARNGHYQIYAPNQNENVYTNDWTGPFYGFRRVIETYKLTDKPRRLKPVDIYFHTYAASKPSALKALDEVYDWALKQPNHPIFPSAYIHRVIDFNSMVIARDDKDWLIYGDGSIDTLRINATQGYPVLNGTVAGFNEFNADRYLHLIKSPVNRVSLSSRVSRLPYLVDANASLLLWEQTSQKTEMSFDGHVQLDFTINHDSGCLLFDELGKIIHPLNHVQQQYHYQGPTSGRFGFNLACKQKH